MNATSNAGDKYQTPQSASRHIKQLCDEGNLESAEALAAVAIKGFPGALHLWMQYAMIALVRSDAKAAVDRYKEVRTRFPGCALAYAMGAHSLRLDQPS